MLKRLFQSTKNVPNPLSQQAELDALTKQVQSLKMAMATLQTPGTQSSTPENSFKRNKARRAVVSKRVGLGEVLQPQKVKKADIPFPAATLLNLSVLASPLFAGLFRNQEKKARPVEAIVHRFRPFDYDSGDVVTSEDDPPCFVVVETGVYLQSQAQSNKTLKGGDTFGELSVIFFSGMGCKTVCTSPGRCWIIDGKTVKLLQRQQGSASAAQSMVQSFVNDNARLFGKLKDAERKELVKKAELISFSAGQAICGAGEKVINILVVVDGIAKLCTAGEASMDLTVGDMVGAEVAALGPTSIFRAVAQSELKLLQIPFRTILGTAVAEEARILFNFYALSISRPLGLLTRSERQDVAREMSYKVYATGQQITRQGQTGDEVFILVEGEVELHTIPTRKAPVPAASVGSSLSPLSDALKCCLVAGICLGGEEGSFAQRRREGSFVGTSFVTPEKAQAKVRRSSVSKRTADQSGPSRSPSPMQALRAGSLASNVSKPKIHTLKTFGDSFGAQVLKDEGTSESSAFAKDGAVCCLVM